MIGRLTAVMVFGLAVSAASGQERLAPPLEAGIHVEPAPEACKCEVCVPTPYTRKTPRVEYSTKSKSVCVPRVRCRLLDWLWHRDCDCQECEPPIPCKVLMKRRVVDECPDVKCDLRKDK